MKRIFLTVIILFLNIFALNAQNAVEIVRQFGSQLEKWSGYKTKTERDKYFAENYEKIIGLTKGEFCFVSDEIVHHFQTDGTTNKINVEDYIGTILETNITNYNATIKFQNIEILDYSDVIAELKKIDIAAVRTAFADFLDLDPANPNQTFVQAEIIFGGSLNFRSVNVFLVDNKKIKSIKSKSEIVKILDKEGTEEAFFRNLRDYVYGHPTDYSAMAWVVFCEIMKKGCKNILSAKERDYEAWLFMLRIIQYGSDEDKTLMRGLAQVYGIDTDPYHAHNHCCIYDKLEFRPLDSGLLLDNSYKNGYGYKNINGKLVIPYKFDRAWPFHNGRACVEINKSICYIDTKGNVITSMYDDGNYIFHKGRNFCIKNGTAYLIDENDKRLKILDGKYKSVMKIFGKYAVLTKQDGYDDIYDYNGNIVEFNVKVDTQKLTVLTRNNFYLIVNAKKEFVGRIEKEW